MRFRLWCESDCGVSQAVVLVRLWCESDYDAI